MLEVFGQSPVCYTAFAVLLYTKPQCFVDRQSLGARTAPAQKKNLFHVEDLNSSWLQGVSIPSQMVKYCTGELTSSRFIALPRSRSVDDRVAVNHVVHIFFQEQQVDKRQQTHTPIDRLLHPLSPHSTSPTLHLDWNSGHSGAPPFKISPSF